MQLSIRDALTIEPLNRAKVLAGENGLDNVITGVNVMEVPDISNWINAGDFLLTTMYPIRDNTAQMETLLLKLAEKGLAGIAIKPFRYLEKIPQSMLDDATTD